MARFKLEALAPRRYRVGTNKDGTPRWFTVTAEDVRMHADKLSRMLAAHVPMPVCFEHRDDNGPKRKLNTNDWATEQAKGTAGWVEKSELDAAGKLHVEVEIPDEADQKKAETLRYCSPQIEGEVSDGDGTEWGRAFVHLALTPKPIHQHQTPIQRLSADGSRVGGTVADVIRLSVNPKSGADMADDTKTDDDKGGKKAPKKDDPPEAGDSADVGDLKLLFDALREAGMIIPDEVHDIPGCIIAIKASGGKTMGDDDLDEVAPVAATGTGPVAMSAAEKQSVARAEKIERATLKNRVGRLAKRNQITKAIADKLGADLETTKLSFGDDGELRPNRVVIQIQAYEALDPNTALADSQADADKTRMSNVRTGKRPDHATLQTGDAPDESPEARQGRMKALDEMNVH